MTNEQFNALAKLMRSRGASKEAVRLVLVDSLKITEAARICMIAVPTVSKAVSAYYDTYQLAAQAVGLKQEPR